MKKENKIKTLRFRCTNDEYQLILNQSKDHKSYADYIRTCIFGRGKAFIDAKEFIRSIDEVSLEMRRVGNNINQFAKYANQRKMVEGDILLSEYNKLLSDYIKLEIRLEKLYRKLISL